jgi:hypothetical protein
MTVKKNHSIFIVFICGFLLLSCFLAIPASAGNTAATQITAKVSIIVFDINVTDIGQTLATIRWKTNSNADSTVEYGLTTGYGFTRSNPVMETNHTLVLYKLSPGTVYHFRVISSNQDGNKSESSDYTLWTLPAYAFIPGGQGSSVPGQNISSGILSNNTTSLSTIDTTPMSVVTHSPVTNTFIPAGTAIPAQTTAITTPVGSFQWIIFFSVCIIIIAACFGYYFVNKKR